MLMKASGLELCCCHEGWCETNLAGELADVKPQGQVDKGVLGWEMCPNVFTGIYYNFGYISCRTFSVSSVEKMRKSHFKLHKIN